MSTFCSILGHTISCYSKQKSVSSCQLKIDAPLFMFSSVESFNWDLCVFPLELGLEYFELAIARILIAMGKWRSTILVLLTFCQIRLLFAG